MIAVSKLDKFLKENTNKNNVFLQEKIIRYKDLRMIYKDLSESIKSNGSTVVIENGSQKFVKINPAIAEKEKLNSQLLNLEKEIQLIIKTDKNISGKSRPKLPPDEVKGGLV